MSIKKYYILYQVHFPLCYVTKTLKMTWISLGHDPRTADHDHNDHESFSLLAFGHTCKMPSEVDAPVRCFARLISPTSNGSCVEIYLKTIQRRSLTAPYWLVFYASFGFMEAKNLMLLLLLSLFDGVINLFTQKPSSISNAAIDLSFRHSISHKDWSFNLTFNVCATAINNDAREGKDKPHTSCTVNLHKYHACMLLFSSLLLDFGTIWDSERAVPFHLINVAVLWLWFCYRTEERSACNVWLSWDGWRVSI